MNKKISQFIFSLSPVILLLGGVVVVAADTSASLSDIQSEKASDYSTVKSATGFIVTDSKTLKTDLKTYIKSSLIAGNIPHYPADVITSSYFTQTYEEVAREMGVDVEKVRIQKGNLAQEIRLKAKSQSLDVKKLVQK